MLSYFGINLPRVHIPHHKVVGATPQSCRPIRVLISHLSTLARRYYVIPSPRVNDPSRPTIDNDMAGRDIFLRYVRYKHSSLSRLSYGSLVHFYLSNAQLSEAALDFKSSSTLSIGLLQPELKVCCRLALLLTDLIKRAQ
jgi:hypothetical protein